MRKITTILITAFMLCTIIFVPLTSESLDKGGAPYYIYGYVYDIDGTKLANNPVTITDVTIGNSTVATTDSDGYYQYDISAFGEGYSNGDTIKVNATDGTYSGVNTTTVDTAHSSSRCDVTLIYPTLSVLTSGTGSNDNDRYGWNVSYAGDVNGDGSDDIAVGAPYVTYNEVSGCGAIYIFFGYSNISLGNLTATYANVSIYGTETNGHFGWSVSDAGDVNQTSGGIDDIIIGEPGPDTETGKAYIFFGRATSDWSSIYTTADANVTLTGEGTGDKFGSSVSSAGDVNNDNYDDVIIGAYANGTDKGKAYIYYGRADWPSGDIYVHPDAETDEILTEGVEAGGDYKNTTADDGVTRNITEKSTTSYILVHADILGDEIKTEGTSAGGSYTDTQSNNDVTRNITEEDVGEAGVGGDAYANSKDTVNTGSYGADSSGDVVTDLQAADWTSGSDAGLYLLAKNGIMYINGFDTTGMSGTVTNAVLHLRYSTMNGITCTNDIKWALTDGGTWTTTGITPATTSTSSDYDGVSADETYIFSPTPTLAQVGSMCINYLNNDGAGPDSIGFDYMYITVTCSGSIDYSLNVSYVLDDANIGDYSSYVLEVRANYSGASTEEFNITYQIDGAGAWSVLGYINSATEQVFTDTLSSTPTINVTVRIVDNASGASPAANTIRIDFIELNCSTSDYSLNVSYVLDNIGSYSSYTIEFQATALNETTNSNENFTVEYRVDDGSWQPIGVGYILNGSSEQILTNTTAVPTNNVTVRITDNTTSSTPAQNTIRIDFIELHGTGIKVNVTLIGGNDNDKFGFSVSDAGDVNNDNYDDVLVGAPYNDTGGSNAGAAYIFYGNDSMGSTIYASDANVTLTGASSNDNFGWSVSDANNVNNDNYNDTIVGAPCNDTGGENAGAAYIFYGNSSTGITVNASKANVTLTGANATDQFGYSVSGAGDINNDGYNDTIVGAPFNDFTGSTSNCGAVYVFNGSSSMPLSISALNANYTNFGETANDNFGFSVSEAGDVNNDNYNDTIVGAPYYGSNDNGKAYVLTCRKAILTVSNWTDKASETPTAAPDTNDVLMLNMTLTASECTITITKLRVDLTGNNVDADVSACRLFHDANDNGAYDSGTDVFLGNQTFSGKSLNFTLSFNVAYSTPEKLLLLYNISSSATPGNTVGARLSSAGYISVARPDEVSSTNLPVQSTNIEISAVGLTIIAYGFCNATGVSKLNQQIDVNQEYYFWARIIHPDGWSNIEYVNVTAWWDGGDDTANSSYTAHNSSYPGGNLNMFLQYENTTGNANWTLKWPANGEVVNGTWTETVIDANTHNLTFNFTPVNQTRWAPGDSVEWNDPDDPPGSGSFNDIKSWNFEINATDTGGNYDSEKDEYGIYRYTSVSVSENWVTLEASLLPGENNDTNMVNVYYCSNYDFNLTIWFVCNLTNQSSGDKILIENNVMIYAVGDLSDEYFAGVGEVNKKYIWQNKPHDKNNVSASVQVRFNVYVPMGTLAGKYSTADDLEEDTGGSGMRIRVVQPST